MGKLFNENYLLTTDSAKDIYSEIATLPIFDYHSHLSPKEIYEDKVYSDIYELWLKADHYKWRIMREAGVSEKYITGDGEPFDKFKAFCTILPDFVGNPVYEWAYMELNRYFDISVSINVDNAEFIWNRTKDVIKERGYSPRTLLKMANVDTLMTTDDPLDSLEYHKMLTDEGYGIKLVPTFRADRVLDIDKDDFNVYISRLAILSDIDIVDVDSIIKAMAVRLDYFVDKGSTIADISVLDIPKEGSIEAANSALDKAIRGEKITDSERESYIFHVLKGLMALFARYDIVTQLHIGAIRNVNTRRYLNIGKDSGIDSIADVMSIGNLAVLLDSLDRDDLLPRSIYYTHNANAYIPLSCMINNFAGDRRGKVQLGAAWWMMDSREGMEEQLTAFKNTAGLGYFYGMLTDSRSFTSFVRHDYFRRVLASFLARIVDGGGVFIQDAKSIARNIAYNNAKRGIGGSAERKEDVKG